jgi:hypothetical protein
MKKFILCFLLFGGNAYANEITVAIPVQTIEERAPICFEEYRKPDLFGDSRIHINTVAWDRLPREWERATSLVSGEIYLDGMSVARFLFSRPQPVLERKCE